MKIKMIVSKILKSTKQSMALIEGVNVALIDYERTQKCFNEANKDPVCVGIHATMFHIKASMNYMHSKSLEILDLVPDADDKEALEDTLEEIDFILDRLMEGVKSAAYENVILRHFQERNDFLRCEAGTIGALIQVKLLIEAVHSNK